MLREPASAHSRAANAFAVRRKGRDEGSPATIANVRHDPDQERSATGMAKTGVCTENSILIDYVIESPNVSGDDRAVPV